MANARAFAGTGAAGRTGGGGENWGRRVLGRRRLIGGGGRSAAIANARAFARCSRNSEVIGREIARGWQTRAHLRGLGRRGGGWGLGFGGRGRVRRRTSDGWWCVASAIANALAFARCLRNSEVIGHEFARGWQTRAHLRERGRREPGRRKLRDPRHEPSARSVKKNPSLFRRKRMRKRLYAF